MDEREMKEVNMKVRVPDYYDEFRCIAGECKDSCCIGWELDIDEESYRRYQAVTGTFGERLRKYMVEGNEETGECNTFTLKGERCPFLNEKNLCDIYTNLGEKALCKVCTEYPRFTVEYKKTKEKSMVLSCEVVGGLLFARKDRIRFLTREIPEEEVLEGGEAFFIEEIEGIRDRAIAILQNRSQDIYERIVTFLLFVEEAQEGLNEGMKLAEIEEVEPSFPESYEKGHFSTIVEEIFFMLDGLEVLGEEWEKNLEEVKEGFTEELYDEIEGLRKEREELSVWYEHLMTYFVFRYFTKAVYDTDVLSKAKFTMFSFFAIQMMMVVRYQKNGKKFEMEDMIDVCRIYSKEVEHSDDNTYYLMEEFLFSEVFQIGNLVNEVMNVRNKKS